MTVQTNAVISGQNCSEYSCQCLRYDYANKAALELFQATWEDLIGQPSATSTTEDVEQASAFDVEVHRKECTYVHSFFLVINAKRDYFCSVSALVQTASAAQVLFTSKRALGC